jgi:tetratricopeptide (TPR) repeat protein
LIGSAANELGRFLARVGNFEESRSLFDEARELLATENDEVELLSTSVWQVESHVLDGAHAAALDLAVEALLQTETTAGVAVLAVMLHRLSGWALMQAGRVHDARIPLAESLRIARLESENLGMRNIEYEIALTLDALTQYAELASEPADELASERDAILATLDVEKIDRPPLPG